MRCCWYCCDCCLAATHSRMLTLLQHSYSFELWFPLMTKTTANSMAESTSQRRCCRELIHGPIRRDAALQRSEQRCRLSSSRVTPHPKRRRRECPAAVATIAVALAQLTHFGLEKRFVASWLFIVFMSLYLGWFLGQRSRNQEAAFFSTRIRPTDSEGRKASVDLIAMLGATFLVGLIVWLFA